MKFHMKFHGLLPTKVTKLQKTEKGLETQKTQLELEKSKLFGAETAVEATQKLNALDSLSNLEVEICKNLGFRYSDSNWKSELKIKF
jgi:hypothetical protein